MLNRGAPDVVVVGAGVVGAACALSFTRSGHRVTVVDRGPVAGGTTGAGEGNLLVSDKVPGPELELALLSLRLWGEVAAHVEAVSGGDIEFELKGGLVVAADAAALTALRALADRQRGPGLKAIEVPSVGLPDHEPCLARDLAGGVLYPQDAQLQPMVATARLLQAARRRGAVVRTGVAVTGFVRSGDRITGVRTTAGDLPAGFVVNAAGTWAGQVAALAGLDLPILPRRGVVLVTQPLPPLVRHKVYAAQYVADVASDEASLESSAVIEGTRAGTVLIGASRERVGFRRGMPWPVVRRLAAQALRLFPALGDAALLRTYSGLRPYCPDHLPVIGPDPRAPGLVHACGHEGAGVGLAAATGHLLAQVIAGETPELDLAPFRPERFAEVVA
ncbi:MAG TPA: FAD-binding oxidoreductase [Kineosporiaceae bacterium]|nr:FAD-binding oxidoreductase [Kineosporiaceae bacterium]